MFLAIITNHNKFKIVTASVTGMGIDAVLWYVSIHNLAPTIYQHCYGISAADIILIIEQNIVRSLFLISPAFINKKAFMGR
jgi:hypothetical protein